MCPVSSCFSCLACRHHPISSPLNTPFLPAPLPAAGCGGGGNPVEQYHKEGGWYEPKYGEGAFCSLCHVIIPDSHYHLMPPRRPDEKEELQKYPFPEDLASS